MGLRNIALTLGILFLPAGVFAAPYIVAGAPEVSYNLLYDGVSFSSPDIRGTAALFDTATGTTVFLSDLGTPASPNGSLLAFVSLAEIVFVGFDFPSATFGPGLLTATVPGIGTPLTAISDPAVAFFVGVVPYNFAFARSTDLGGGISIQTWVLTGVGVAEVPEPGTASLAAFTVACLGVGLARRRSLVRAART